MKKNVYAIITDRIIELLEQGTVPWQQPWAGQHDMPMNLISKKQYRGINIFLLASMSYESPYWITFNQVHKLGGTIKKGEKACPVVFWKWREVEDKQNVGTIKRIPMLRYYHVFNAAQCEGIDAKVPVTEVIEHEFNPIRAAELIAEGMPKPPTITHDKSRAYYNPALDLVNVPRAQLFRSDQEYYSTLFHELVHATGHDSRLKRHDKKESVAFGSETYSKEELVAEMGCAFLCGASGIVDMTIKNSAAYISSWLKRLKDDVTLVVTAAGQAQKASDYILNVKADGGGDDGDMT